ncbi:response regulator [Candidatus Falkowbacteria bacterium]|nr:response regulator [Candidatus Falkowbacteria bacterium]
MKKTILIVEDEKSLQRILFKKLQQVENWEILQAFNGQQALDLIKEQQVDLILLDIVMPVMDGLTLLQELKDLGELGNKKVIVLTNSASFEQVFRDNGVKYLVKSNHTLDDLVKRISNEMEEVPNK